MYGQRRVVTVAIHPKEQSRYDDSPILNRRSHMDLILGFGSWFCIRQLLVETGYRGISPRT